MKMNEDHDKKVEEQNEEDPVDNNNNDDDDETLSSKAARLARKAKKKEEGRRRAIEIAQQRRLSLEQQQQQQQSNDRINNNNTNKRHGARNQHRHKFFVRWLIQTFPHIQNSAKKQKTNESSSSSQEEHVLDVAGGKGELSARLTMCHNAQVVMIDPRESYVEKCFNELVFKSLPKKWQQRIEQRKKECGDNFVKDELNSKFHQLIRPFDQHSVQTRSEMQTAVKNSSLLIGLHADAATEDIVDVALAYGKPFVVVPCCVFPNFFKARRLIVKDPNDNQTMTSIPVRSHDQFCQYLLQKDPRFKIETLPFEGRNIAIWWEGPLKQ